MLTAAFSIPLDIVVDVLRACDIGKYNGSILIAFTSIESLIGYAMLEGKLTSLSGIELLALLIESGEDGEVNKAFHNGSLINGSTGLFGLNAELIVVSAIGMHRGTGVDALSSCSNLYAKYERIPIGKSAAIFSTKHSISREVPHDKYLCNA